MTKNLPSPQPLETQSVISDAALVQEKLLDGSLHSAGSAFWVLFQHMSQEHGLTLLDSELSDICHAVDRMRQKWKADEAKRSCPQCWGSGQVEIQSGPYYRTCDACGGSGQNAKDEGRRTQDNRNHDNRPMSRSSPSSCSASEIKDVIAFYEQRGWDWSSIVCFLSMRQNGLWPIPIRRTRIGFGRPRSKKQNGELSHAPEAPTRRSP